MNFKCSSFFYSACGKAGEGFIHRLGGNNYVYFLFLVSIPSRHWKKWAECVLYVFLNVKGRWENIIPKTWVRISWIISINQLNNSHLQTKCFLLTFLIKDTNASLTLPKYFWSNYLLAIWLKNLASLSKTGISQVLFQCKFLNSQFCFLFQTLRLILFSRN